MYIQYNGYIKISSIFFLNDCSNLFHLKFGFNNCCAPSLASSNISPESPWKQCDEYPFWMRDKKKMKIPEQRAQRGPSLPSSHKVRVFVASALPSLAPPSRGSGLLHSEGLRPHPDSLVSVITCALLEGPHQPITVQVSTFWFKCVVRRCHFSPINNLHE